MKPDGFSASAQGIGAGSRFESTRRASRRGGLELLADQTGGRAVFDKNEFGRELTFLAEAMGSYYSLAYRLPPTAEEDTEHRIDVRLADRSHRARFRRGWIEIDPDRRLTERLEGALSLGIVDNTVGARLGAGAFEALGDGTFTVPLRVMLPIERLTFLPQGDVDVAELTIRVLGRHLEGRGSVSEEQRFRVKRPAETTQEWVVLPIDVELARGPVALAVGIRDDAAGVVSFVSASLDVGD